MKQLASIALLILSLSFVQAQTPQQQEIDKLPKAEKFSDALKEISKEKTSGQFTLESTECGGNGALPSRWDIIRGKAVSILDGDTILVEFENKNYTIDLIGIDAASNQTDILLLLNKYVLDRDISVSVKWQTSENLRSSGVVNPFVKGMRSVNEYLLESGMAAYKPIEMNALDDGGQTDCQYEKLEAKAKAAKIGIWAK